jgi:HSP20 family protein
MTTQSDVSTITRRRPETVVQSPVRFREVTPQVDVYENAGELLVLADMPGAAADSVGVRLEGAQLTLEAERSLTGDAAIRYYRAFRMPDIVDPNGISAELEDGVLHVHLKKTEAATPRTIPIRSS